MKKLNYLFLTTLIAFTACKKDKQTNQDENVSIEILETNSPIVTEEICDHEENNVLKVISGNDLIIKMKLLSGAGLSQYKIEIHNNFDCHGHETPPGLAWEYSNIVDLTGNDTTLSEKIIIPEDAKSGNYHCVIRLVDKLGNEAEFVDFNIVVENKLDNEAPIITITDPNTDTFIIQKNTPFIIKGKVTDNLNLKLGSLEGELTWNQEPEFHIESLTTQFIDQDHNESEINHTIILPSSVKTGSATLVIRATDFYNNFGTKEIPVKVID